MILVCLISATAKEHWRYLRNQMRFPNFPPTREIMQEDTLFYNILEDIPDMAAQAARRNTWILQEMWTLVDMRMALHHEPTR